MSIVRSISRSALRQRCVNRCVISVIGFNENTLARSSLGRWQFKFSLQRKVRSVMSVSPPIDVPILHRFKKCQANSSGARSSRGDVPPFCCWGILTMFSSAPLINTKGISPNRHKLVVAALHRTFILQISLRHQDEAYGRTSVHAFLTSCINHPHTSSQCGCRRSVGDPFAGDVD